MNFLSVEDVIQETEAARKSNLLRMETDEADLLEYVLEKAYYGIRDEASKGKSYYILSFDLAPFSTFEEFACFVEVVKQKTPGFGVVGDFKEKIIHFMWYSHK